METDAIAALKDLAARFDQLPETRLRRQPQHRLGEMLLIGLCSMLGGGRSFNEMEDFGVAYEEWLRLFMELPAGIPSHDTFNRLFAALDTHAFEQSLREWTAGLGAPELEPGAGPSFLRHLAMDGKTLRGEAGRARQVVNVLCVQRGIVLAQRQVPPEGSEIVHARFVLKGLDLKKTLVTADAAHAQTETAAQIVEQGGNYLLCVKGSQPTTHAEVKAHLDKIAQSEAAHAQSVDKEHGRIEQRRLWISHGVEHLEVRGQWKGLGSVLLVESQREPSAGRDRGSVERRYYLCSLGPPLAAGRSRPPPSAASQAEELLERTRSHWRIENSLHWRLDVQWGEDACRARERNAATNLSALRKVAMNLLTLYPPPMLRMRKTPPSMRSRMFLASCTDHYRKLLIDALASLNR